MITIETLYEDQIETLKDINMFDKKVIYDSEECVIIKWADTDGIVVYIPRDKEKDLLKLPEHIREKITKEMI